MFKIAITLMIFSSLLLVEVAGMSVPPPPGGRRKRELLLKLATQQLNHIKKCWDNIKNNRQDKRALSPLYPLFFLAIPALCPTQP